MCADKKYVIAILCALLCLTGCERNRTDGGNGSHSLARDVMPRVPSPAPVNLYAIVTGLSNAAPLVLRANTKRAILVTVNGSYLLLSQSPRGMTYTVDITSQPPGHTCTLEQAQGVLSASTKPVLVSCALAVSLGNGLSSSESLGQPDGAQAGAPSPPSAASLNAPQGKTYTAPDGTLFVADTGNNRVLGYFPPSRYTGEAATVVLGQSNSFTTATPGLAADLLNGPTGVGGEDGILVITDKNNHRVLIYNSVPNGQTAADIVLGQPNFVSAVPACSPVGLNSPTSAAILNGVLVVADTGNHRVLFWRSIPKVNRASADLVLGQATMTSCAMNGGGWVSAYTLNAPQDIFSDGVRFFVADTGNRRVLGWHYPPIIPGEFADFVIGQDDMSTVTSPGTTQASLAAPLSVAADANALYVADANSSRIAVFSPLPRLSGLAASYTLGQVSFTNFVCNQNAAVPTDGSLCFPTGVSFSSGSLVVTDTGNNRVQIYHSDPNAATHALGTFLIVTTPSSLPVAPIGTATAGRPARITVTAINSDGSTDTAYRGTIDLTSSDPNAVLSPNYTFDANDQGVASFTGKFYLAGVQVVTVQDVDVATSTSNENIFVAPGDANHILVAGFPSPIGLGVSGTVNLSILDNWNNIATGYTGTVQFGSSDSAATLPANIVFTTAMQGVATASLQFDQAGITNITATDTRNNTLTGTEPNIFVTTTTGPAVSFSLTAYTSPVVAGTTDTFTVTALDANAAVAVTYAGTVHFTSTDPNAVLPADTMFAQNAQGVQQVTVSFVTAGNQTLAAADTQSGSIAGNSNTVVVEGGNAVAFGVSGYPGNVTAGQNANVTVRAVDAYGNTATGFTGLVNLQASDPAAVLSPNHMFVPTDSGSAFIRVVFQTSGGWQISANAGNAAIIAGEQNNITVSAGPLALFLVNGYPSTITAGISRPVFISPRDAYGNIADTYNGVALISTTDPNAVYPTTLSFNNGIADSYINVAMLQSGTYAIAANDTVDGNLAGGQGNILVTAAAATSYKLSGYPSATIAGQSSNVTITVVDAYGNLVPSYTGSAHVTSTDTSAVLPPDATFNPNDNATAAVPVTLRTAGMQIINANDTKMPGIAGNQNSIVVNANAAVVLRLSGLSASVNAGAAENVVITARDAYGNVATSYTGIVHLSSTDANASLGGNVVFSAGNQGTQTVGVTLATVGNQSIDANDMSAAALAGSISVRVQSAGTATTLRLSNYPASVTAGQSANVTVAAYDAYGNIVPGYTGTVHLHGTDPNALIQSDLTFVPAYAGAANMTVTFKTSGIQTIDANDVATPSIAGAQPGIIVNPNVGVSLQVKGFASPIMAGTPNNVTVTAYDAYANVATGYVGQVSVASSDVNSLLPANYSYTGLGGSNGIHTFAVTLRTAGNQNITATDTMFAQITGVQNPILVNPATANHFSVSGYVSPDTAGTQGNVVVVALDAFNNVATGYTGTLVMTSSDASATLPGNLSFTGGMVGTASLPVTLLTVGSQSISANDLSLPSIAGQQSNIVVISAAATRFVVRDYPAIIGAGVQGNVTVAAYDNFNNLVTGYAGTVHISTGDVNAVLPGNLTYGPGQSGVASLFVTFHTSGSYTIDANDVATPTIAGNQIGIVVLPGNANFLTAKGFPNPVGAGAQGNLTVTAYDVYGNIATGYTGTVVVSSADPNAVKPGPYVFSTGNAGVHALPVILQTIGNQNIVVTDTGNIALTATEANILVTPGAAVSYTVTGYPATVTAGQQGNVQVVAYDAYHNIATGYTGTLHVTSSDANAGLPLDVTFAAANAGNITVLTTLKTAGLQSINGNDYDTPSIAGREPNITVNPNVAARLRLSGFPSTVAAGQSGNVTLTALDAYNNIATGYTGTVSFTSDDPCATFPASKLFLAAYAGVTTVPLAFGTAGNHVLTGNDTVAASIAGALPVTVVNANSATHLIVANYPSVVTAGQAATVKVLAADAFNNVAASYMGRVQLYSTDLAATLPGAYQFQASDQGNVLFSVTLNTAGVQAISANDLATVGIAGMQNFILVNANVATRLMVNNFPATTIAGSPNTITVTAYDNYGNIATGYTGLVHLSSSDPNAALSANTTLTKGTGALGATLNTTGTWWINANDVNNPNVAGRQSNIVVTPNAVVLLVVGGYPTGATACQSGNVTVRAVDAAGNTNPNYTGTVTLTTGDPNAALPAATPFTAGNAGSRTFSVTFKTPGTWSIVATDNNGLTASDGNIAVTAGSPNIVLLSAPASVQPTQPFAVGITVTDNCNNVVTGYTGTINLTSSDAAGTPSSTPVAVSFTAGNAGVNTATGLQLRTPAAPQTLYAKDYSAPGSINGSIGITVAAQAFYAEWDFATTNQASYLYNTGKVDFQPGYVELSPVYTMAGSANSTAFATATASTNVRWDTGVGALVLGPGNANAPALLYIGGEPLDPVTYADTIDTGAGGNNQMNAYCCGVGPEFGMRSEISHFGTGAYMFSGNGNTAAAYANMELISLHGQNFRLDGNSFFSYWVYPANSSGYDGGSVSGNNTEYVVLNISFTDGTMTTTLNVNDTTKIPLKAIAQGSSGRLTANTWTLVQASLAGLAGKTVDHIGMMWQTGNATGGYRGYFDDIILTGSTPLSQTNNSQLAADWTPSYSNLVAYYPFNGVGRLANGATVAGAVGPNLTVSNSDGNGFMYGQGKLNQAVYFDGVDDYFTIPTAGFPNSNNTTIAGWVLTPIGSTQYYCGRLFYFGTNANNNLHFIPTCNQGNASESGAVEMVRNGNTTGSSTISTIPGHWSHVAVTVSGNSNQMTVYLNGTASGTATAPAKMATVAGSTNYIGRDNFLSGSGDFFTGWVDEFAVWNVALSANDIAVLFNRQSPHYTGLLTSQVLTSPFQASGNASMSWGTNLPSFKPLPSDVVYEKSVDYTSLTSGPLSRRLETLWHFDETALGGVYGGDFYDDTGHGNVGVAWTSGGTDPTPGVSGLFNQSIYVNTSDNGVIGQTASVSPTTFSSSVWFQKTSFDSGVLLSFGDSATGYSNNFDRMIVMDTSGHIYAYVPPVLISSPNVYVDGLWHNATITAGADGINLYVDGAIKASSPAVPDTSYVGYWHVGCDIANVGESVGAYCFVGQIDEVAIWSRELQAAEVLQLYRRGNTRLKYRLRTCANATCSDNQIFRGPDGTYETYFSELSNVTGRSQLAGRPSLGLATYAPGFAISANQPYLQFQAVLESDDTTWQCAYNSMASPCSPENSNILLARTNYDTTSPTIANANAVAYSGLTSFADTPGYPGCPDGVTFTLSPTGASYYYYNGSTWTASNGTVAQTNTQTQITASALTAFANQFGVGKTYFQAWLTSLGINPCSLESVVMTGVQ